MYLQIIEPWVLAELLKLKNSLEYLSKLFRIILVEYPLIPGKMHIYPSIPGKDRAQALQFDRGTLYLSGAPSGQ